MAMRSTLFELTKSSGATFMQTGEWELPLYYSGIAEEYQTASSGTVVRDVSPRSRLRFSGEDHLAFLHRMTTNDFSDTMPGAGFRAVFADSRGRIIEVGTFYRDDVGTLAVLGTGASQSLQEWLDRYIFAEKMVMTDTTEDSAMVEIVGSRAIDLASEKFSVDLSAYATHEQVALGSRDGLWAARIEMGTWIGLRVWGAVGDVEIVWQSALEGGATPCGEEAFAIHRIEAGIPLQGRELSEEYNPWEAGLEDAIHMNKGCYIGQEVIARLDTYDKVKQHLSGLRLASGALPELGTVLSAGPRQAGTITSVAESPRFGNIALGYVRNAHRAAGTELEYLVDGNPSVARVAELPFS
jgi:folate-binding protein YgfZ